MPRAPKPNVFDAAEVELARNYVAKNFAAVGVQVEVPEGRRVLVNGDSGVTYAVAVTARHDGCVMVLVSSTDGTIYGAEPNPTWLAIFDVEASEVHLVDYRHFVHIITHPAESQGFAQNLDAGSGWTAVKINVGWLRASLSRKSVVLGTGRKSYNSFRGKKLATKEDFCHLHAHSTYSLLDGAATVAGMAHQAMLNGQPGVALTDHGNMFGAMKFYKACKDAGVKPVLGVEAYLVDDVTRRYHDAEGKDRRFEYHQTILAMDDTGWENLCTLVSKGFRDHYYYVPRIDHKMLFEHNQGLIVLSGCFKGPVAWHLQHYDASVTKDLPHYRHDPDRSRMIMREYRKVFGDRYYVELHNNDYDRYMDAMPRIAQMAADEKIPCVVAADAHYEVAEDAAVQALMTKISTNKVDDLGKDLNIKQGPYYIRTRDAMEHAVFTPDMLDRTCEVMERCNVDLGFKGYLFPTYRMEEDVDWEAFQQSKDAA